MTAITSTCGPPEQWLPEAVWRLVMQARINAALSYLRPHGQAIGATASAGDALSKRIVDLYTMLSDRPEHATLSLLESAIEERRRLTEPPRPLGDPNPCSVVVHGDSGELALSGST